MLAYNIRYRSWPVNHELYHGGNVNPDILKRYTNIPSLLHILNTKTITLLDPNNWDDTNDAYSLKIFKEKMKLKTLLAICFTESAETYHHWHVFAGGPSGVCINFNRDKLLECFDGRKFEYGPVDYKTLDELRKARPLTDKLPFIKRAGYVDECEYRIIYKDRTTTEKALDVDIPIDCIERITLSPWMHSSLKESLTKTITSIDGCKRRKNYIFRSSLRGNSEWKKLVSEAI